MMPLACAVGVWLCVVSACDGGTVLVCYESGSEWYLPPMVEEPTACLPRVWDGSGA